LTMAIVEKRKAVKLAFIDAIKIAVDYSRKNGIEAGFLYDPKTRNLLTGIIAGTKKGINLHPYDARFYGLELGDFHTHPGGRCAPSWTDLGIESIRENVIATPDSGLIIRVVHPRPIYPRIKEILRLETLYKQASFREEEERLWHEGERAIDAYLKSRKAKAQSLVSFYKEN